MQLNTQLVELVGLEGDEFGEEIDMLIYLAEKLTLHIEWTCEINIIALNLFPG
jgi:hypothetical protein